MNIIEAYIKFKHKLIIIISGMSGSGKTKLAKNISKLFKLNLINLNNYCNKNYNVMGKLPNGKNVINWDSDNIYNWDKFNEDVKNIYSQGVIITGISFTKEKIKFNPDFHIHIKLSKQNLFNKRKDYIEEHMEECKNESRITDSNLELIIFNTFTYPYYLYIMNNSNITKYINANNLNDNNYDDKLYDETFDYLINQIEKKLYNKS